MPYRYITSMGIFKSIDRTCDSGARTGHRCPRIRADARCRRGPALKLQEGARTCAPGRLDAPARFSPYSLNDVRLSPCRLALAPLSRSGSGMWLHALITATPVDTRNPSPERPRDGFFCYARDFAPRLQAT